MRSPQPGHHCPRAVGDVELLVVGEDAGGVVDQARAEREEAAGVGGLGNCGFDKKNTDYCLKFFLGNGLESKLNYTACRRHKR